MSEAENKDIVRRYYEAINTGDVSAYETMFAPDYVLHSSEGAIRSGSAAQMHAQIVAHARASLPDLHYSVEDLLADGDKVVARTSQNGTLLGALETHWGVFPPTGQRITATEISIHRFVDGRIAEQWWELDWASMLTQLGAIRAPA